MSNPLLQSALHYHGEGLCVIPIVYREKNPALPEWEEYQERRSTLDEVENWFGDGKLFNLGIVHGAVSNNYIAIDIDKDVGIFEKIKQKFGNLFAGRVEQSGSGKGFHIPLRLTTLPNLGENATKGRRRGNKTWKTKQGVVNIRISHCQTVAPPSIHPCGNRYRFIQKGNLTTLDDLDDLINWLDTLAPPPAPRLQPQHNRLGSSPQGNDLVEMVASVWGGPLQVFKEFGLAQQLQTERNGEIRLLGNGGLLITEDGESWYNHSDEFGGGLFEAWGWCRFGSRYDKHQHFRQVLLEMAKAGGIEIPRAKRAETPHTRPIETNYWSQQFVGYWERVR